MLEQLAPAATTFPAPTRRFQCRVYQRLACELPGYCQPAAAHGSKEARWAATVRDISQSGVGLQLRRRYEPGTGLAIELPTKDGLETSTYYVKVVHIKSQPDGAWALGCQFVSPLSEDELQNILGAAHKKDASEVELLLATSVGELVSCRIKRFFLPLPWPPSVGTTLAIRAGSGVDSPWSFKVQIVHCRDLGRRWVLGCHLLEPRTAAEVLTMLEKPTRGN